MGTIESGARAAESLPPGARIGDWIIEESLASGGFGSVYRVRHALGGDVAALKLMHAEHAADAEGVARFDREIRAVERVRHENVVRLRALGSHDDRPYLVMELLEGVDLDRRIAERGALSAADSLAILEPLCAGLTAAHAQGIIHRDLKASNVFLARSAGATRVVLLDFGIAKLARTEGAESRELTGSRQAIGTPSCMAPEQVRGEEVDVRTDVYALGVLAYQMLTGRPPFDDPSPTMLQYLHVHAKRPRPSALAPLDAALDDVVCRAMSTRREDRHATPAAFLDDLRRAVEPRPRAPSPSPSRMLAVHVAVLVPASGDPAIVDEALDAMARAKEALVARGYVVAWESAIAMLCVRPLADLATPAAEADAAHALWQLLASARERGAPTHVAMHAGDSLLRPALWDVPARTEAPLLTTSAAAALGVAIERVEADLGVLMPRAVADGSRPYPARGSPDK